MLFIIASGRGTILDTMDQTPVQTSQWLSIWRLETLGSFRSVLQHPTGWTSETRHTQTHDHLSICCVPCTALSTSHVIIYHLTLKENPCDIDRLLRPWDPPSKNTAVGCHFLLQGIFPTQRSKPPLSHLLHCRWILTPEPLEKPTQQSIVIQMHENRAVISKISKYFMKCSVAVLVSSINCVFSVDRHQK